MYLKNNIRIYYECEGGIEKSAARITVWHHESCRGMTNVDHKVQIFRHHYPTNNKKKSGSSLSSAFLVFNKLTEVPEYAEMQYYMMMSL